MARSNKRSGFGNNRGAVNPKVTLSDVAPTNPKINDLWLNTSTLNQFYWNGIMWVPYGGTIVPWTAGENLNRGESLYINQSNGNIYKTPIDGDMAIGFAFADASSSGTVYIVTSGMAYVLPESGLSLSQGYVIYSSGSAAGRVQNASTVPSATQHFREQGHVLENSSGNGVITRCIVHFN